MAITLNGNSSNTFPTPASTANAAGAGQGKTATQNLNQNFDQFLRLLTTQLKNQDPLSPMDSTQFTNQLVSFSQVEQQIKMNDNLSKLINYSKTSEATLGLGFIGLKIDMDGDTFHYAGTGEVQTSYRLPSNASKTQISVIDKNGNVVYSRAGDTTAGVHSFVWDGKMNDGTQAPSGSYQVRIGALDAQQKAMDVAIVVPGIVEGIENGDDGIMLLINGAAVPMSSVHRATL